MNFIKKCKEIYQYRHMLKTLVKQDIRGRYKGSIFGFLWTLLNPLLLLAVYSVVFQFIFKLDIEYYTIYLFIALMPWNTLSNTIAMGTNCVTGNAGILKKVYFPREILPLATVISNVVNYIFSLVIIFIALLFFSPIGLSAYVFLLPVMIIIQAIFTLGITLMLSAFNVYVRDVQYIMNPVMMIWMYACPILYSVDMVPEKFRTIYNLNPMVKIIEGYRDILYYQQMPNLKWLAIIFGISLVILYIGYVVFEKLQRRFAEEV